MAMHLTCFVQSIYSTQQRESMQQGDPLGPLQFCLTIHPLVSHLRSVFRVSLYLEDGTLGNLVEDVLSDFRH